MSDKLMPEMTELKRSWIALLQEIAILSDAMGLDSGDWCEADECTLQQEFDPWLVIREAVKQKKRMSELKEERDKYAGEAVRLMNVEIEKSILEARVEALVKACRAALYLFGNDADRAQIGEVPWGLSGAASVPDVVRAALEKET